MGLGGRQFAITSIYEIFHNYLLLLSILHMPFSAGLAKIQVRIHRGGLSQKEQIILSAGTSSPSKNGTSFLPHLSLGWGKRSFWRRRLVLGFRVRVRDPLGLG